MREEWAMDVEIEKMTDMYKRVGIYSYFDLSKYSQYW